MIDIRYLVLNAHCSVLDALSMVLITCCLVAKTWSFILGFLHFVFYTLSLLNAPYLMFQAFF